MAEVCKSGGMADALVSGASDLQKSCGFNSHLLHQTKTAIPPRWRWGPQKIYFLGYQWQTRWVQVPVTFKSRVGSTPISCTSKKIELRQRFLFESLKTARFFCLKRQTKMQTHFALALMRRKLFQERVKIIIAFSRPNATRITLASWSRLNKVWINFFCLIL